jgi:predicted permease
MLAGNSALRIALRGFARNPLSALTAVVALALGISGAVSLFSVVDASYLRPLPFHDPERLVRLRDSLPTAGGGSYVANMTPAQVLFLQQRAHSFDRITAQRGESPTLLGLGDPEVLGGASVSPGSLELLGMRPVLGRLFNSEEEKLGGASPAIIVSDRIWRERLGADLRAVGRSIRLDDRVYSIVGVAPPGFHFPYIADVWLPMQLNALDHRDLLVIARLRKGAATPQARTEMTAIASEFRHQTATAERQHSASDLPVNVTPLREELMRGQGDLAIGLLVAAAFFLLIACADLAGWLVARVSVRRREFALRMALGADSGAQIRLLMAEPILLACAAGGVAVLAVLLWAPLLSDMVPRVLSEELGFEPIHLSAHVVFFTVAVVAFSALLAGMGPALSLWRIDIAPVLGGTRGSRGSNFRALRSALVVEIALLSILLVGAASIIERFVHASQVPVGFEPRGVIAMEVHAPTSRYRQPDDLRRLVSRLQDEISALPVTTAAISTINPLGGGTTGIGVWRSDRTRAQESEANSRFVSPGLFATLKLPLLRGRDFTRLETTQQPTAIVSRRLAQRMWGRLDVLGEHVVCRTSDGEVARAVVGVAGDVADAGSMTETIYLPYDQTAGLADAREFWIMVRGRSVSAPWIGSVEKALWRVDRNLAWSTLSALDSLRYQDLARERLGSRVAGFYALFAIVLAALGLGSATAFIASQRDVEIAIRLALGEQRNALIRAITMGGLRLAAWGLLLGLVAATGLGAMASHLVPGFQPPQTAVVAGIVCLIASTVGVASYFPALRAASQDPQRLLRS